MPYPLPLITTNMFSVGMLCVCVCVCVCVSDDSIYEIILYLSSLSDFFHLA